MDAELSEQFGNWLSGFEWHYFGTFTFDQPRRSSGIGPVKRWWHSQTWPQVEARAFIADEYHRDGDRIHVHGLFYSDPRPHKEMLWGSWRKHWGRERILEFNPRLGAAHYCAKYLVKDVQQRADFSMLTWHEGKICDGSEITLTA